MTMRKTILIFIGMMYFLLAWSENHRIELHWLDQKAIIRAEGVTWGVPWKQGVLKKLPDFQLVSDTFQIQPVQSWVTAYWPDGSIKWTAHAAVVQGEKIVMEEAKKSSGKAHILASEQDSFVVVKNAVIECLFSKSGNSILHYLKRNGQVIATNGRLAVLCQDTPDTNEGGDIHKIFYESTIKSIQLEQNGEQRCVVKVEGIHQSKTGSQLLPFILRFYFYKDSPSIRILHTFIYDVDENKDFIKGIGFRIDMPLTASLHNRYIRFVGEKNGVFAESIRTLTGLRRDPGQNIRENQINGSQIEPISSFKEPIRSSLNLIPAFGDYTLTQWTDQSFSIRKRTREGHAWIGTATGGRSQGVAFLGTPDGGLAFGLRNFWQSYPAQIDIRDADKDTAQLTLWMWSPQAPAMDLRFYHDGLGMDTYTKQRQGLDITYEDYEPGFGTPQGVARTSELSLSAWDSTPSNQELVDLAAFVQTPGLLICSPEYILKQRVFGGNWTLPDSSSVTLKTIEEQLTRNLDYYKKQIDQHRWYGFWNFGDFMHTYDSDRHVWRYDVGGYAWDNSELSTDLWLWYSFLRTGDASVFRMAEAMTRHTGEVDVYHLGRFAPLGSRHNVQHWGCSAKQMRISTVMNRRFLYYLTADERIGDLMREQVDAVARLLEVAPLRKINDNQSQNHSNQQVLCSFGTDWGAVAAAWFTEWERTLDKKIYTKLTNSMKTIAQQPHQFFTGKAYMNVATGKFKLDKTKEVSVSHLSTMFGLVEICSELFQNIHFPAFEKSWLNYCMLYNASGREQKQKLGQPLLLNKMPREHSRITAFAAYITNNAQLGQRAWREFFSVKETQIIHKETQMIYPPLVLNPVLENTSISTNTVAQWSLAAMQNLTWAGQWLKP